MSIDLPSRATLTSIDLPLSRILDEVQSVVLERHRKYGSTNISNSPGGPLNGLRVRLHDKLARLNNAVDSGNTDFDDDSFRDCFIDVVGYGLIGLLVVDGDWPDGQEKPEKPLADLVDRDAVARVLTGPKTHRWSDLAKRANPLRPDALDNWRVGTTFKADKGDWTWNRGVDGWSPTTTIPGTSVIHWMHEKRPSLEAVIEQYYPNTDGTITEPSTLQKEAA